VPRAVLIIGSLLIAAVVVAFFFRPGASGTASSGAQSLKVEPIAGALAFGDNGAIYAAGGIGYVYALNPDGSLAWKYRTGRWGIRR
jgi:outer membrane protein assembly factor BamB